MSTVDGVEKDDFKDYNDNLMSMRTVKFFLANNYWDRQIHVHLTYVDKSLFKR